MYIEIETQQVHDRQIPSRKTGHLYFVREQPALLFTDGSKYPRHFSVRLAFDQDRDKRDGVGPIAPGKYLLTDEAYTVDRFGAVGLQIEAKTLKPLTVDTKSLFAGKTGTTG